MRRFLLFFLLLSASHTLLDAQSDVRIVGVQFHIQEEIYVSPASFAIALEKEIRRVVLNGKERPDLVVFPEYASVFLALTPYAQEIQTSTSIDEALAKIRIKTPVRSIRQLFLNTSGRVEDEMDRIWGGLARKYRVALISGTYFAELEGDLFNLCVVYDEEGNRIYHQAKVYLTEFEREIVGLEPGTLAEARLWELNGLDVGVTICRDTFFESWNTILGDGDYWIDIKANGTVFDGQEAARFRRALPERIADTEVSGGMTVCLTGRFLDLFWEGRSFTVNGEKGGGQIESVTDTATGHDVLTDVLTAGTTTER